MFLMWLGEQITSRGIGNGVSLIIMAGIVARFPTFVDQPVRRRPHRARSAPFTIIARDRHDRAS